MERRVCAEWPEVLCPAPGCLLPVADTGKSELALVASDGIARRVDGPAGIVHSFNKVLRGARAFDFGQGGTYAEQSM